MSWKSYAIMALVAAAVVYLSNKVAPFNTILK
jgi:hypothetical protein